MTSGTQPKGLRSFSKDVTLILNDCDALSNDQLENALDLTGSVMTTNSTVYYHSILYVNDLYQNALEYLSRSNVSRLSVRKHRSF